MKRIYENIAYDTTLFPKSYWAQTIKRPPKLESNSKNIKNDIAIIGGGFTGLNAALELKEKFNQNVSVIDAGPVGWGASGRNGGFACMGGTKKSFQSLLKKFGHTKTKEVLDSQIKAVNQVNNNLVNYNIEADKVDGGELLFAHSQKSIKTIQTDSDFMKNEFGFKTSFLEKEGLKKLGISSPEAFAGVLNPVSFGLNPLKYATGLYYEALKQGINLFYETTVTNVKKHNGFFSITTNTGTIQAKKLIIATNGYSSDDMPIQLNGGYLPVLSSIIVTRPLTKKEIDQQGWTSQITSYDARNLLHYVRLLPDNRFLFGARGGTSASHRAQFSNQKKSRKEFERMFPAWAHVDTEFYWNGFVCVTADLLPFIGPIDDNVFCSLGYHGNGVTTASLAGRQIAQLTMAQSPPHLPTLFKRPLKKFPFPKLRRLGLRFAYVRANTQDWLS
jgi:glycine/D-amino acid oxidase-like deaminating enzyme